MIANNHIVYFGLILNNVLEDNADLYYSHTRKTSYGQLLELTSFLTVTERTRITILDFSNSNLLFFPLIKLIFFKKKLTININHNLNSSFSRLIIKALHSLKLVSFTAINNSVGVNDWIATANESSGKLYDGFKKYFIFNPRRRDQLNEIGLDALIRTLCERNCYITNLERLSSNLSYELLFAEEDTLLIINYSYDYYRHSGVVFDSILKGRYILLPESKYYREIFQVFPNVGFY